MLDGIVAVGSNYEIRNARNFLWPPVRSGRYTGGSVTVPLARLAAAEPVGAATPPPSGPEFNAFVVISTREPAPPPPVKRFEPIRVPHRH